METFHIVIGVILGVPCGIGLALYVVSQALDKSNNFGDSTGSVISYSDTGLMGVDKTDNCRKDIPLDGIQNPVILTKKKGDLYHIDNPVRMAQQEQRLTDEIDSFDPSNGSWHK